MAQFMCDIKISFITSNTALMILIQIICTIKYKPLLDAIIEPLINSDIPQECRKAIEEFPENVRTYSRIWKLFECKDDLDCKI